MRHRVFCASLADVFEDWQAEIRDASGKVMHRCRAGHVVSLDAVFAHGAECQTGCNRAAIPLTMNDLRADLFRMIDKTPWLDWQLLTKRPENIARMWPTEDDGAGGKLAAMIFGEDDRPAKGRLIRRRDNVWLGTSISDQATAEAAIHNLLKCKNLLAPVTFLSAEPLLGPVNLLAQAQWFWAGSGVNWVIIGGESGAGARPCEVQWIRDLVKQCKNSGVPCFVKQLGAFPRWDRDATQYFIRDSKGGDWEEWPADLRVREFPLSWDRSELR